MPSGTLQHYIDKTQAYIDRLSKRQGSSPEEQVNFLNEMLGALATDLEELEVAEQELRSKNEELAFARQRYQDLFNFAPDAYLVTDEQGIIQEANQAAGRLLGMPQDELMGKPLLVFVAPADRQTLMNQLVRLSRKENVAGFEIECQPWHGVRFPAALSVAPIIGPDGRIAGLRWLMRDVSERIRSEDALRELAQRAVLLQEQDRRFVAHELHEELGQSLVSMRFMLDMIDQELPDRPTSLRDRFHEVGTLAHQLVEQVRTLGRNLRPPALDTLGLNATLEGYCAEFSRQTGAQIEYRGSSSLVLPDASAVTLYRFLQGALASALSAHASSIHVSLGQDDDHAHLSIQDNSPTELVPEGRAPAGVFGPGWSGLEGPGLVTIRERLELLGGTMQVRFVPGEGTLRVASVPLT